MSVTGTLAAAASLALFCQVGSAQAAVITGFGSTSLPGTGTVGPIGGIPAAPNNDGAAGTNPNTVAYNLFFNSDGLLEVEFRLANSDGTTEYRFLQSFLNLTSQSWSSFAFELGFGSGASFVRSTNADGLDFDLPDNGEPPSSSAFATIDHQSDLLHWSGGTVGFIGRAPFAFSIDVPDDLALSNPYGANSFTLRQTPNAPASSPVPEPTSLAFLGVGLLGMAGVARRTRSVVRG
jgi:PEP-CTERM motif